ncbi:sigma-70 family RNA polymerase sigma factor [Oceanirhabdus seepicola]|uniref:Sigma-70 family RNA polymerase sigma factor n=1 Tax=Oceanirhabdus seepicola TaxID=2828781 RepID=A0A9J6P4Y1_9CLOT|nr:sigma-70 family RNA polymerase sigma factor [Oceanirhabdus seepicola]MCM1991842.1 sigma-70 family RNA polymerase sigma factor [Oceanirhabdus seepicola]
MQQLTLLNHLNDKEIEEKELTYIFEAYYERVYNYIFYRVSCHYTSEDLTSQVFEKIVLKIGTYSQDKSPFEVWLFAIARNTVNDYFRKQKKQKLFSLDTIKELVSREKTPEDFVVTAETNDKLLRALRILNSRDRNIIALKFGSNLKNNEIAKILGITESNVGVIIYRTMKKLKKEIEREGEL